MNVVSLTIQDMNDLHDVAATNTYMEVETIEATMPETCQSNGNYHSFAHLSDNDVDQHDDIPLDLRLTRFSSCMPKTQVQNAHEQMRPHCSAADEKIMQTTCQSNEDSHSFTHLNNDVKQSDALPIDLTMQCSRIPLWQRYYEHL